MNIAVFAGPTLPHAEIITILGNAELLPPAARGDVYLAVRRGADAIALIDGYFHQQRAVWHKELLWALANGVRVYGSASMGALRAAELCRYGMIGIGNVFEAFLAGVLEDDDEVAIVHAPVELGYLPLSDAMVDIRVSLQEAERCGVIDRACCLRLTTIAKAMHYSERSYQALLERADQGDAEIERLRTWLPNGQIRQKADDARMMLVAIARECYTRPMPSTNEPIAFEETLHWLAMVASCTDGQQILK